MIDAARRWKARATDGCAQAPALKPQADPRSPTAKHDGADSPDEARRFSSHRTRNTRPLVKAEDDQRIGFEPGLRRLSANRRPSTRQGSRWPQWNAERLSRGCRRKPHHSGERRGQNQRRVAYETIGRSRQRLDQTEYEGTDGLDGDKVPLILRHDGPQCSASRWRGWYQE